MFATQLTAVNKLLRISLTQLISTMDAKRLGSKVTRILNTLRSSKSEDRLKAHVLNETHKESLPNAEDVVKKVVQSRRCFATEIRRGTILHYALLKLVLHISYSLFNMRFHRI